VIEQILSFLSESWKWVATIIEILCVVCFTVPKIRAKIKNSLQNFIGLKDIKEEIKKLKDQVDKIEKTLDSHLENDKEKLEAQMFNLKESLMRSFHFYAERGYITLEERNTLQDVYNSYRKFGGNGVFKEFWEGKILKLPDKPPNK
jgi:hypothetical protein